jgi:phenylpyruvate tautomerase PptA (4-oxalocrotonate tautomerase family)
MPFFEVYDFNAAPRARAQATRRMTEALCEAYEIPSSIVSVYFTDVGHQSYGHDARFGDEAGSNRLFVRLHAYPRPDEMRRAAARLVTQALAEVYETSADLIAVYFLDREAGYVSHGGVLASDHNRTEFDQIETYKSGT